MYYKKATIQDLIEECTNILMENSEEYVFENVQSHDKLFRDILNNQKDFKDFIKNFVNEALGEIIEKEELQPYNKRFITNNYTNLQADIIYKVNGKPMYFLVEHQSKADENMAYRIFDYVTELIKEDMKARRKERVYPKVIPIVLYTGKTKWKVSKTYKEREFNLIGYSDNFVNISYHLVDINKYTEEELLEKNSMIAYAMLIEKGRKKQKLLGIMTKIGKTANQTNTNYIIRTIKYLLNPTLGEEAITRLIQNFKNEGVIEVKNVLERIMEQEKIAGRKEGIKKGMKKGLKEGIKEGLREGKRQLITNMLLQNLSIETISNYTGISIKEIEKIQKEGE